MIEAVIAGIIVCILSMVAYPSFSQQIAKSRRADAKSTLVACAQMLERYGTQRGNYAATDDPAVTAVCTGKTKNGYYRLPASNVPETPGAQAFTIVAEPIGPQAGDECGSFSFTQNGTKGLAGASVVATSCW